MRFTELLLEFFYVRFSWYLIVNRLKTDYKKNDIYVDGFLLHVLEHEIIIFQPQRNINVLLSSEYTVRPVLRGHFWEKEKNGLLRQVTS